MTTEAKPIIYEHATAADNADGVSYSWSVRLPESKLARAVRAGWKVDGQTLRTTDPELVASLRTYYGLSVRSDGSHNPANALPLPPSTVLF